MSVDTSNTDALSEEEQEEILQEVQRRRTLGGLVGGLVALIAIAFSAFQLWLAARGRTFAATLPYLGEVGYGQQLQQLQVNAIHVTFALVLAFLLFPPTRGRGPLSRRLSRLEPAARSRFGPDSTLTRLVERLGDGVRWAFVDPAMRRVTPVDVVLIFLSLLPAHYIVTKFDEIRQIPVFGIQASSPIQEVYTNPLVSPIVEAIATGLGAVGIPLDSASYAFLLGVLGLLLVLEATRRTLGPLLMGLVAFFIVYARWGHFVPRDSIIGSLAIQNETWGNIVYNLWYTVEAGVMSTPVTVSVRFIYIFILFGAFLEMSGAGKWFIDLAYALTGTRQGGPAKASVVSSGFMGMLSGSSIANTVTTGAFTIPLMKRSGYSPEFSGAVESSASSGGQMLPPVMGAAAFLIVEYLGVPYADVIIAATLPAIAFFFGMWIMVHFEAVRGGIGGLPRDELPAVGSRFREGWFYLVPIALLLYYLVVARLSIGRAGWYTIVAIVALIAVVAAYNERNRVPLLGTIGAIYLAQTAAYAVAGTGLVDAIRAGTDAGAEPLSVGAAATAAFGDLGAIAVLVSLAFLLARPHSDTPLLEFEDDVDDAAERTATALGLSGAGSNTAYRFVTFLLKSMDSGARTATTVVVAVAAAGVVPGVISVSGLGPNLAALIDAVSGGSMLLLLSLTGVASIIFGMGMPTTAMYIILIAMLETPLVEAGIVALAAHLFVLYFGLMADVTPPVAVAAFAGAGVAKADELKTASTAFLLSLNKILVPFAFVFSPGILLLQRDEDGWTQSVMSLSDVADLGFFVPEVVIPVLGMFLGVYALGVTIIGYQYAAVSRLERAGYSVASILLMVPEIPLLILEGAIELFGVPAALTIFPLTVSLRAVGLAILVGLSAKNRRVADESESDLSAPTASDA
ncbi:TRAP transporter permease [Halopiger xanaduensis]|uniref:TRAP transporter, 4TM/12TM fusion protein n=1 Tax=Halopiger xanaduensis (strain DSM 18323 / JCM 14033 / SH-6) TaxID=797210 RepID=F8DAK9_HALXS|nr:TRAP transporter fused permease subunit [Halopiger xanaduensis]AEH35814.1 TRAP transporter, 4TM/12TM fusion protein [Halopiger xanaduensis SH-6]